MKELRIIAEWRLDLGSYTFNLQRRRKPGLSKKLFGPWKLIQHTWWIDKAQRWAKHYNIPMPITEQS